MSNLYQRNGIWWARFKVSGEEYRFSLRTRVRKDAERRMKAERTRIEDEARFRIAGPVSWPNAVVAWNEAVAGSIADGTLKRYVVSLAQMRPHLDGKAVHEVDAACLREIVTARRRAGATNATIRRDLTAISSVLANAEHEGWIDANTAATFNRKRIPEKRDPIVLPVEAAIATMVKDSPTRFGDMIEFARETGMREDEIAGLSYDEIDLTRGIATLHRTKGKKVRAVPLTAHAAEIIKRQPRFLKSKFVFWHTAGERYHSPSSKFGAVARRVAQRDPSFARFKFHDLRHLFAVEYLAAERGSIYTLQGIMGHSSIKTTELYLSFLTPEQAQAAREGVAQNAARDQRSGGK